MQNLLNKIQKPIVLVGMMGAGKSHIGSALANALARPFFDVDKVIEEKANMSIPEIFEEFGETKFRDVEKSTIVELLEHPASVIATGGGALENIKTLETLKARSHTIWLDVDIEKIWARIKDSDRPLIQKPNPREVLEALMKKRRPQYAQAETHIKVSEESAAQVVQKIIKALSEI